MNKKIFQLAVPSIISNITVTLLGLADLAILGHLESEVYIGAMALGTVIFNMIYWVFAFLRMGTSGFTAQAYGARNLKITILTLSRGILVGGVGGLLVILLQKPIALISFYLINGAPAVETLAAQYFYIRIYAAPAAICLFAINGWFIGMQNAKAPMVTSILINIVNIGFNVFFVFGLGMKSDGVALGTVIAQYTGLIASLFIINKYYRRLFKYWSKEAMLQISALKQFFRVNTDIFLRMICIIFVFTFFTAQSANIDSTILAVNTVLLQFLMIFSFIADAIAYAAEALVGKYIGANNRKDLIKSIKYISGWSLLVALLFTAIYGFGGTQIISLLTDNQQVIETSKPYIIWAALIPVATILPFLWDGVYIGATESRSMFLSVFLSVIFVFIPVFYLTRPYINNHGIWLAMILFMFVRGLILTFLAKRKIFSRITSHPIAIRN